MNRLIAGLQKLMGRPDKPVPESPVKSISIPNPEENLTVVAKTEIWEVRWIRRIGAFHNDLEHEAEFFTNEEDARKFYDALRNAQRVLRNTDDIGLKIKKKG